MSKKNRAKPLNKPQIRKTKIQRGDCFNCGNCMYQECDPLDRSSWPCYTCDSTNSGWKPKET